MNSIFDRITPKDIEEPGCGPFFSRGGVGWKADMSAAPAVLLRKKLKNMGILRNKLVYHVSMQDNQNLSKPSYP